jgi:hypothetical protein
MWLELTQQANNQAVWVNTDLVTHVISADATNERAGSKLVLLNSAEIVVKESLDRIMERLQLG